MRSLIAAAAAAVVAGCGGGGSAAVDGQNQPLIQVAVATSGTSSLAPVNLRKAGTFVILTESGVTDVRASAVKGDVGSSPITGAALLLSCDEVTGTIYTVDAAGPACAITDATKLTTAVGDMETAYTDAAGRLNPNFKEFGAGEIGGETLKPGLYNWSSGVLISSDVTLEGSSTDIWILQIAGTVTQAGGTRVTLKGGALPKNIYWQAAGAVTIGTYAHFEGVMLAKTMVAMKTGATMNGRLLAQTAVTLEMNTVTQPADVSNKPAPL